LGDKSIKGSLAEKRIEAYCGKVTLVWCGFFVLNGATALYTVFWASDAVWSIYNGGISYILMGILFAGEFIVRKMTDKKMPKAIPLSRFTPASRPPETILCYERAYGEGIYKTWKDFLEDTAVLRRIIRENGAAKWLLHCEDCWYFLAGFTALLQCGKEILLTANISPAYIAEIRDRETAFLTDQVFSPEDAAGDTRHIPSLLSAGEGPSPAEIEESPEIEAEETAILIYTSGTTGKPKAVRQRLKEFEIDNAFILSKWGEEFLVRKICSTVSQHHIYGLLFSILLPFTVGIPFRRNRIQYPEEFEVLTGDSYMIITVPAFLKRSVEIENAGNLRLRSPWIFTSGGVLTPDVAEKTSRVFGFWPLEVYGSTETSGIAYRQSKNGLEWTPFDKAQISKNEEGCLVIRSPYIRDPAGFVTGDLVDLFADGRFLLKGRADFIVKIEEKRVSLTEVESRILQSGLVNDVCVVSLSGKRQYLAAALVFNSGAAEKFRNTEKYLINRYFREYLLRFFEAPVIPKRWRYMEALPTGLQGKKKKDEIRALFETAASGTGGEDEKTPPPGVQAAPGALPHGIPGERIVKQSGNSVVLELEIPAESDYFDGHFPDFKILPAAAQFELAIRLGARYFGASLYVGSVKRVKFSNPIRPGSKALVELNYEPERRVLSYKIREPRGEALYSAGTLKLGEER
jgi:acyl-coenzyme A synthetase/AMP-(fatty) acid ligase